ncbi:phospho-2-dehydro-3-deoxyheptonate aldolase [Chitinispirillum alkaliphilum]|nr:phospho-2-dehydro-3-deoxyheptonate aldolase [Chitinispirillum alkaliphilum]
MENISVPLVTPAELMKQIPQSSKSRITVEQGREDIKRILDGKDDRLLLIVGPCSIHDPKGAIDYAKRLNRLRGETEDKLLIVMRLYFEKPRTALGWKGLVHDPDMNGGLDMHSGLTMARKLLSEITGLGLPAAMEMLDPLVYNYVSDLVSWTSIGARTSESQIHRQSASGIDIPVGFKNSTDGSLETAVNAIKAASSSHCYPGIDPNGRVCLIRTKGNHYGHIILRGGKTGPNYDKKSCLRASMLLNDAEVNSSVIVDCSHMNCSGGYDNQMHVWKDIVLRKSSGESGLKGIMAESYLEDGNQKLIADKNKLLYGISVTDSCIGWKKTEKIIRWTHNMIS